jgi:hypothetical protein
MSANVIKHLNVVGQHFQEGIAERRRRRIAALGHVPYRIDGRRAPKNVRPGQISTLCADLTSEGWPVAPSSVWAIICVHFAMIDLIPSFLSSLQSGLFIR